MSSANIVPIYNEKTPHSADFAAVITTIYGNFSRVLYLGNISKAHYFYK